MKANATSRRRDLRADERGVSEAVGYVVTFGISTIILITSLHTFNAIQDYTKGLAIDRALRELGSQVAFAVEEALRAGATYPDTTFSMQLSIPRDVQGEGYRVYLDTEEVWLVSVEAWAEEFDLAGEELDVHGRYYVDYAQRAGVTVLCPAAPLPPVAIPGGSCFVNSEEGELTVVFNDPAGPLGPGVYFLA